jgi:hypothetical protein
MKETFYTTSWTWIGANSSKRYNVKKAIKINGKTNKIEQVKSFETQAEADCYANKLNKEDK